MKQKMIKRITAQLLAVVLLFSSATVAVYALAESESVLVTIKTDKQEYAAVEVANVTVQIENRSGQTLNGVVVSAEAEHWLLARGSNSNVLEVGNMNEGEARTFSFRCVLDRRAPGIRFLNRVRLFFRQLISRPSTFKELNYSDKSVAVTSASVTHGGVPITVTATAGYQPIQKDEVVTEIDGAKALSTGVVSYLQNPNNPFYYIDDNQQMRSDGFNAIYDWSAGSMIMYYDTWRACFTYDNTEWMIQGWKGQYGFLYIGGEIGIYTRNPGETAPTSTHYYVADDNHLINMEMTMHYDAHDGNGYEKLFTRTFYPHWWCNGFVDGHLANYKFNDRSCLIMEARLSMYDKEMAEAFAAALVGCGFTRVESREQVSTAGTDTFTVVGNDVYYAWKTIDQGYKTR